MSASFLSITANQVGVLRERVMTAHSNLVIAWIWILLGFFSGMLQGMFFNRENWLGGYNSLKRRLYRLAHISFFGLGAVNLFFYFTALRLPTITPMIALRCPASACSLWPV